MESRRSAGVLLNSDTMSAASNESPPKSRKKSSSTETGVGASSFSHTVVISFSRLVRGGTRPGRASTGWARGAGNLLRSTFPLASVGSRGSVSSSAGTI